VTRRDEALLVLADGSVFEGEAIGAPVAAGVTTGEVVFNTALSGYQEILTDPSYSGQIISFTYPHIGNYGVNGDDFESRRAFCSGVIVRDLARRHSNWRAELDLESMLIDEGVAGISGIDTRRLTRAIRDHGSMAAAFGTADEATLLAAARAQPTTDGIDLVAGVSCVEPYAVPSTGGARRLVAYDFGIKRTILRHLSMLGDIEVVPASTPAAEVLARDPDGVFLSNGPGDPEPVSYAVQAISGLLGHVPVFGICLGHQLLSLAVGAETYKLPFGHHGGNHPVRREATGGIEITSQNHNYAVAIEGVSGIEVTHRNLNDGVVEGLRVLGAPAFSVQYHPEAGPGPHDSRYLFAAFDDLIDATARKAN
jgi:carbamoyl-phosphate synthase small subunit